MQIETLTEKITSGKFSAVMDYDNEQAIFDGFGAVPFDVYAEFMDFMRQCGKRIGN